MKVQVLHDAQGNILSFAVVKSGSKQGLSIAPEKGYSIKVVDVPGIVGEVSNEKTFMLLREAISKHKVDVKGKTAKLIRKSF